MGVAVSLVPISSKLLVLVALIGTAISLKFLLMAARSVGYGSPDITMYDMSNSSSTNRDGLGANAVFQRVLVSSPKLARSRNLRSGPRRGEKFYDSDENNAYKPITPPPYNKEERILQHQPQRPILFYTLLFFQGRKSPNSFLGVRNTNNLLTYLKSIGGCRRADFMLVSNLDILPHEQAVLPSNVFHVKVDWSEMVSRMARLLGTDSLQPHSNVIVYEKTMDYKPMLPILYPELFTNHSWFGWMDNDVWLGSEMVDAILLAQNRFQAVSFVNHSWGPLSAFQVGPYVEFVTHILQRDRADFLPVFRNHYSNFDEWGGFSINNTYHQSMSRVISEIARDQYHDFKIVYVNHLFHELVNRANRWHVLRWDGHCVGNQSIGSSSDHTCNYARMTFDSAGRTRIVDQHGAIIGHYHFQHQKKRFKRLRRNHPDALLYLLNTSNYHNHHCFESSYRGGIRFGTTFLRTLAVNNTWTDHCIQSPYYRNG